MTDTPEIKRKRRIRKMKYERLTQWIVPVVVSVLLIFLTLYIDNQNNHKFCSIVKAAASQPVEKPSDPNAKPAQETQYEWYVRFKELGTALGC
jgi:hypothetical protein